MQNSKFFWKVLTVIMVVGLVFGLLPTGKVTGQSSSVQAPYIGMWISTQELASLPTSGSAWNTLLSAANQSAGSPDIQNQDSDNDVNVLAKALVYAATSDSRYRTEVLDNLQRAMGSEQGGRTLALGRNLVSYVIAADLVNLPAANAALDKSFRDWLRVALRETLDGKTLVSTHEDRPNNWGTHAGASRAAAAIYLGDRAELERTATVFKGWLGDRAAYSGFSYGELDWQCNPAQPVGINPKGCVKNGHSIDGALPEELRRAGGFQWPPAPTGYAWEGMQGAIVQAWLLQRAGYPVFEWSDRALLRAYQFLYTIGWTPGGDDMWQVWLVNAAYHTSFPTTTASKGKNMGWTDWSHQMSSKGTLPTAAPTSQPTSTKTSVPGVPTAVPTIAPTNRPTAAPTNQPTVVAPTANPPKGQNMIYLPAIRK